MNVLQVYCSDDKSECNKLTLISKLKVTTLNEWKSRRLTMIGRVQILKTSIISPLLFIFSAIVIPQKYMVAVNKRMIDFALNSEKAKLSHNHLTELRKMVD